MAHLASETTLPGALLVNDLPFREWLLGIGHIRLRQIASVRYIPEWLPWLSYKPLARYGYNLGQEVQNGPMKFVRESIVRII